MTSKGIYTALSGAMTQSSRLDTIANNLANVNTPAFKKDQQVFKEYLAAYENPPDVVQVPRVPASVESFYDTQGGEQGLVDASGTYTDFSQGAIKPTGNPLDIAIEGKGMLEVLTPGGVRYTRNGALKIDPDGKLVTKEGYAVLRSGTDSEKVEARTIQLKGSKVSIGGTGEVYDDITEIAKLSLVHINPIDGLQKIGSSLYGLRENFSPQIDRSPSLQIHQGYLETSNVEIVKEMTDMISATRSFDSNQRAIKTYDEMLEKLVNMVPRLEG